MQINRFYSIEHFFYIFTRRWINKYPNKNAIFCINKNNYNNCNKCNDIKIKFRINFLNLL